jgi:hypothetical protein
MTGKGGTAVGRTRHFAIRITTNAQKIGTGPELFQDAMVYVGVCCGKHERRLRIQLPATSAI